MCIDKQSLSTKKHKKRKDKHPGVIDLFLANPNETITSMKLYPREIGRLERKYPEIIITKDKHFNTTDLWECTITKRK